MISPCHARFETRNRNFCCCHAPAEEGKVIRETIRVFCRLRPPIPEGKESEGWRIERMPSGHSSKGRLTEV
jgi:hypothetical protein